MTQNGAVSTDPDTSAETRTYGLAAQLRATMMGRFLLAIGLFLLVATVAVMALDLPRDLLTAAVVLTVVAVFSLGFLLVRKWYVVRLDDTGYEVRFVRGAGARAARWNEVDDLSSAQVAGSRCAVLRLRDGRSTTIPVDAIEGDPEEFLRELGRRLKGHQVRRRVN